MPERGSLTATVPAGLLKAGYRDISVVEISGAALRRAQTRLGPEAGQVEWIEADIRSFKASRPYALWHDRAVFHFLTDRADQARYVRALERSVQPGARLIIGTFAPGGPRKCSGLDIVQYDARSLHAVLGANWRLREEQFEVHLTPSGSGQKFGFYRFERKNTNH